MFSGEYLSLMTTFFISSKASDSRWFLMNPLSSRPSSRMTWMKLFSQATSVPGNGLRCMSASFASCISLGSTTMSLAPLSLARRIFPPMMGCCSVVFDPVTRIAPASNNSLMELVMAPLPKAATNPATVEA